MSSEIKRGVILNYVSIGVRLLTSFLLTPFIIDSLGVEEYGLFTLSSTVIVWLALSDLGLGATVSKYVVTYRAKGEHEQQAHFLGQSVALFCLISVFTLTVGVVCFFQLESLFPKLNAAQHDTLKILFLLALANLILAIPLRPLSCLPGAYQKFVVPGLVRLSCSLLNAGLTVALLLLGFKSVGLTVLAVGIGILNLLWELFYSLRILKVKIKFSKPDWKLYRGMFVFSIWVFMNQIMDLFYWKAGSPILANVCGTAAVAVFILGISFSNYFTTASNAISGVLAPKLMHMVALNSSKEELSNLMVKAGRLQLFVLISILLGFIFLGQDFLKLWVGKSMGDSVTTVWLGAIIILIPLILPLTQNTGVSILQALEILHGRAILLFISSLICVILGYSLSKLCGTIGMFIGTSVSCIIGQGILMNWYYSKKAGLHIFSFFQKTYFPIILPTLILCVLGFIMQKMIDCNQWSTFILCALAYAFLSFVILFVMYLNNDERTQILPLLKKYKTEGHASKKHP